MRASTPFRDRNPLAVGALGLMVIALLVAAAFRVDDLPLIGGGDRYFAAFEEAGGLKVDDEVRIAGVRVGNVESMGLQDGHVRVGFRVSNDAELGSDTAASINVSTLLGKMFLALEPAGAGHMAEGSEIPIERTTAPFSVVESFSGVAEQAGRIDTTQLTKALSTLTALTQDTPDEFRHALAGLSALSRKLASRDGQLNELLRNVRRVSHVLGDRDTDLVALMRDADVLFRSLVARRHAIHRLLEATAAMSRQLSGLVRDSAADLEPALAKLAVVVGVLLKNQDNLDRALRLFAPFLRMFTNVTGNGPWLDGYIQNMPPQPAT